MGCMQARDPTASQGPCGLATSPDPLSRHTPSASACREPAVASTAELELQGTKVLYILARSVHSQMNVRVTLQTRYHGASHMPNNDHLNSAFAS